ncbi:DUF885 family protein [Sphingomonas baiyangensis]|uniref:DUF885 domain-containing protein n=1 Tax=Sphingomonas baiyangensis TaxID=2572576 RepID=A0A4U1KZV8_9SPHN|nr:DUF885 family protein [Sphingomonas baiyangensis]TKD49969.1 DUF885 domain-containing protein [Sphingomonas baiyangensis]
MRQLLTMMVALAAAMLATPAQAERPELVALFKEFRTLAKPVRRGEVPDYTDAAMATQARALPAMMARLKAMDEAKWPVADRVDYMLLLAEMRGLEFRHRVVRPWKRDPAFYSTTNLGFGPKIDGAFSIPELPLAPDKLPAFTAKLAAVPAILAQARGNLTEARGDLARLGITQKGIEARVYQQLADKAAKVQPELAAPARAAAAATRDFAAWLERIAPTLPAHGGIGRAEYDWYLRYVLLFPYTWEEMRVIGEREHDRAMVSLKLEEHRNRGKPMTAPAESMAEFERRRGIADAQLLDWFARYDVMTVPDWLKPPVGEGPYVLPGDRDPAKPGPFDKPVDRHFFRMAEDREPLTLRAHNLPGHLFDQLMRQRDTRAIRGAQRLFFIDGTRAEGWSFYLEEMIQQIGILDDKPAAREINYILHAKRAARVLPELMLHANAWTYDEALASLTSRTPYWMGPQDAIARFDMELYLRQPGYGIGYHIGKVQFEALMADIAAREGREFQLKRFHDRFHAAGVIPISLIRWEMTGDESEVARMR